MEKQTIIKITQWLSEAILFYFVLLPIFYYASASYPFESYIVLIFGSIIVYTVIGKGTNTYFPIGIGSIIIAIVAYKGFQYPLIISLVIAIYFGWRFISHEKESDQQRNFFLLIGTFVLMMCALLLNAKLSFLLMGVLQVLVLIGSSFIQSLWQGNHTFDWKGLLQRLSLLVGIFVSMIFLFWALYPLLQFLYYHIGVTLAKGASFGIAALDRLVGTDLQEKLAESENGKMEFTDLPENHQAVEEVVPAEQSINVMNLIYIGLFVLGSILLVLVAIKYGRKILLRETMQEQHSNAITTRITKQNNQGSKLFSTKGKPENKIRRQFYTFEAFCHKKGYGRNKGETVEEWFDRINLPADKIAAYFHVRYNDRTVTESEIELFKQNISWLKSNLLNR